MPVDRISITTPNLRIILGHTYNMFHIMLLFPSRITTIIILTIGVIIIARNLTHPKYFMPGMAVLMWLVVYSRHEIGDGRRADFNGWYTVFTLNWMVHFDTLLIHAHLMCGTDE